MAFEPLNFNYTPPPTVTTPASISAPTKTNNLITSAASSKAGQLISQLNDLSEMSKYLQEAILGLTGSMGVELDPSVDPNTSRALCQIYGTTQPPSAISIVMYSNMVNALLGTQQLQSAVGLGSSIQPNPVQVGDLITASKAVESALIASPSATNFLPLQLASLRADDIVFNNWSNSLSTYPITYAKLTSIQAPIQASSLDISDDQFNLQSIAIAGFQQAYSSLYQSMAAPSATETNAGDILQQLIIQPLSAVLSLKSMFMSMNGLLSKSGMSTLTGDLINFSFANLVSDTSRMLTNLDQLTQLGSSALQTGLGSLGQIIASVQQQAAKFGTISTGVMAGMSSTSSLISGNTLPITPVSIPSGPINNGLKQLGEMISWGQSSINGALSITTKSFQQLLQRRIGLQNDRQSLMNAQNAIGTISGLLDGVIIASKAGALSINSSPTQQQNVANSILTSLQTGSQSTFVASGNQVIVNPPTLPPTTPAVSRVLATANITSTVQAA